MVAECILMSIFAIKKFPIALERRHELALRIREALDTTGAEHYRVFLNAFFDTFQVILTKLTKPQVIIRSVYEVYFSFLYDF